MSARPGFRRSLAGQVFGMTMSSPPGLHPPRPAARSSGGVAADVTVTVLLMLLYAAALVLGSAASLLLGFLSDGCGEARGCDGGLIGLGVVLAMLGTWAPFAGAVAGLVVQAGRRRPMWWVPLAGLAASAAVFAIGVGLAAAGGPHH